MPNKYTARASARQKGVGPGRAQYISVLGACSVACAWGGWEGGQKGGWAGSVGRAVGGHWL